MARGVPLPDSEKISETRTRRHGARREAAGRTSAGRDRRRHSSEKRRIRHAPHVRAPLCQKTRQKIRCGSRQHSPRVPLPQLPIRKENSGDNIPHKRPVLLKTAPLPAALAGIVAEKITPQLYNTIITVSPSTKDMLLRLGARQVHIVPNAVDHQTYKPGSKSPIPLVVWINRFAPYKNPQDAVKIFTQVKKVVPEARFVMVGGGPLLEKTKKLAANVAPFIEFTGRVSTETKVKLLQEAWACLYTSDVEGFGLGILESAACETPCVAYNVPGVRDAIIHRKTGLLVPHRDTKTAATTLTEILRNDQLRKSLAQAARQYANQFNWDKSAEKLENILSTLITK